MLKKMILLARILDVTAGAFTVISAAKKTGEDSGIDFVKLWAYLNKKK